MANMFTLTPQSNVTFVTLLPSTTIEGNRVTIVTPFPGNFDNFDEFDRV
jgi:hypothetical protein